MPLFEREESDFGSDVGTRALSVTAVENDFVERRPGKALREDVRLRDIHDARARLLAFAQCLNIRHRLKSPPALQCELHIVCVTPPLGAFLRHGGLRQNHTESTAPMVRFSRVRHLIESAPARA